MPRWFSVERGCRVIERRPVSVSGVGLLSPAGRGLEGLSAGGDGGTVLGFRARNYVADRKSLRLMTVAVQLGVSAVQMALDDDGDWSDVPPERRGIYVGASPQTGDPDALRPALEASMGVSGFDMKKFAADGFPLIHPLWLVRGLSNNIIGFAAAIHDLQGVNANYCDGIAGGVNALREGALAVAEGRADLVVAGGADAWSGGSALLDGAPCGDGAAFVVFRAGGPDVLPKVEALSERSGEGPFLGSATVPVAFCKNLLKSR